MYFYIFLIAFTPLYIYIVIYKKYIKMFYICIFILYINNILNITAKFNMTDKISCQIVNEILKISLCLEIKLIFNLIFFKC